MRSVFSFVLAFIVLMGFVCAASYDGNITLTFSSGDEESEMVANESVESSVNNYLVAGLVIIALVLIIYYLRRKCFVSTKIRRKRK